MSGAPNIHPTAVVDPSAKVGEGVAIGAYTVVGPGVEIGAGTRIGAHCTLEGPTRIGRDNRIHGHVAIGGDAQDKKFGGERAELVIGDRNVIREFCTFSRGTADGGSVTCIGNDNWIMAYVHIAHDCIIGNNITFANAASLAGHVQVDDHVIFGGFTLVHQFCKVGRHAFTSMGSVINRDVPPFVTVAGNFAKPKGINSEGLRRHGFDAARIGTIKRAYKALYLSGQPLADSRSKIADMAAESEDARTFLEFIERSERSLVR